MAPTLFIDLHLLMQAIVYAFCCITSLVVVIPVGVTMFGNQGACSYIIVAGITTGLIKALILAIYFGYATYKSRTTIDIGSTMWAMPYTLSSCLVIVLIFIAACIQAVGFSHFCNGILEGFKTNNNKAVTKCSDTQTHLVNWNVGKKTHYNTNTFYSFMTTAQSASWILLLAWFVQLGLGILRLVRNRRLRSQGCVSSDRDVITDDVAPISA